MHTMQQPQGLAVRISQGARPYQEDNYGFLPLGEEPNQGLLLVLADGMGGQVAGALASETAIEHFISAWREQDGAGDMSGRLENALAAANRSLREKVDADPTLEGMGCTLVGAVIADNAIQWVSVGDSPLWIMQEGRLQRLNEDHSMAPMLQNLVEAGRMSAEEAATDSRRNVLRSAVMGDELELIDRPEAPLPLHAPVRVLLASDGLQTLNDEEIADILSPSAADSGACADRLMAAVEEKHYPNQDNVTALVYDPCGTPLPDVAGVSRMSPGKWKSFFPRPRLAAQGRKEKSGKWLRAADRK